MERDPLASVNILGNALQSFHRMKYLTVSYWTFWVFLLPSLTGPSLNQIMSKTDEAPNCLCSWNMAVSCQIAHPVRVIGGIIQQKEVAQVNICKISQNHGPKSAWYKVFRFSSSILFNTINKLAFPFRKFHSDGQEVNDKKAGDFAEICVETSFQGLVDAGVVSIRIGKVQV